MKAGKMSLLLVLCLLILTAGAFAQPDLTVTKVSFKEKGNGVEIAATIKNVGQQDANSYSVKFFADNQLIDTQNARKLKKNRTKKITSFWDTSNLSGGDYPIKIEVVNVSPPDADVSNNTYNTTYHIEENSPDLKINEVSFKTKNNDENSIEITATVQNIGSGDASSYLVNFYADEQLINSVRQGRLRSNRTGRVTTEWDISNLSDGEYAIKVEISDVDPDDGDVSNNSYTTSYTVEAKKPDLVISNMSFRTKTNNDEVIEVTAIVKNIGDGSAESFTIEFFANDTLFSSEDLRKLRKNQTIRVRVDWRISDVEPGEYEIKAQISSVEPTEADESNNIYTATYTVIKRAPDLTLSEISFNENGPGGSLTVMLDAQNIGDGDADSYLVSLYYSALNTDAPSDSSQGNDSTAVDPDSLFDESSADTVLIGTYAGKKLKAGNNSKIRMNWDYLDLPFGEYLIIAEVTNVSPAESDTSNNLVTATYEIPCPDLYVYDVKFAPGPGIAKIDHHTTIDVKIKNSGAIKANHCKVGIYYDLTPTDSSDDPNLSAPIGGELIEMFGINPNDQSVSPIHVQWEPAGLLPDVVYPVYVIISDSDPEECDTTNNIYVTSYFFQESGGDSTESTFSLISPGMGTVLADSFATFSWQALSCDSSKKDTMNVFYTLYIDTDSLFSNPVIVENISDTSYTYGPFEYQTNYYWKVGATNCRGKWLWSNEVNWYFTVNFSYGFSLLTPFKGDTVQTLLPSFTWEPLANEDTSIVIYYDLYLDTDSSFTNPLIIDSLLTNNYTLTDSLTDNAIYYWKVKAYNNAGTQLWSREQNWYFAVINSANNNPSQFSLLSPAFDDTVHSVLPEFKWQQSFDPDSSDSVSYLLYLSTDSSFAHAVVSDAISDTTYVPVEELMDSTTYYWKVKAIDENGGETWSTQSEWHFYIAKGAYATLETPGVDATAGETFVLPILLDNMTHGELPVYSFQMQLQFDTTKLSFMEASLTDRTNTLPITFSSAEQTISITMNSQPGVFLGSGTGAIANLQFLALQTENVSDTTTVNFVITQLLDEATNEILTEAKSGAIAIQMQILLGDLNSDGKLDLTDLGILLDIVMGTIQPDDYQEVAGDINSDGQIDLLDIRELVAIINPPVLALEKVFGDYQLKDFPIKYEITQNYPNPFNSTTMMQFTIPEMTHVNISIYNIKGQLVKTLVDRNMAKGFYNILWDGTSDNGNVVSSGTYFYIMKTNKYTNVKSLILLK